MSAAQDAQLPSRAAFEKALTVATEGKDAHGLYAVEDAQALLEPIGKFYWRQSVLNAIPVIASLNAWVAFELPWYAPVLGIVGGILVTYALVKAPLAARMFAPAGYTPADVAKAQHALWRSKSQQ